MFDRKNLKPILLLLLIILVLSAVYYFALYNFSLNEFKDYVNSFGNWVPFVLLLMIIISSSIGFFFMIPVSVAALILDARLAFLISILGLSIGAMTSFYVARYLGRDYFERRFINKVKKLKHFNNHLEKKGFLAVFFMRLITLSPYELINITAGLSRIHPGHFFLATLVGIIPGTIIGIYFVKSTNDIGSLNFYIATILLTALAIIPLLSRRLRKIIFG